MKMRQKKILILPVKKMKRLIVSTLISLFLLSGAVGQESPKERDTRMQWWREARFGMFIHWGVYAQMAGVYKGHEQARAERNGS